LAFSCAQPTPESPAVAQPHATVLNGQRALAVSRQDPMVRPEANAPVEVAKPLGVTEFPLAVSRVESDDRLTLHLTGPDGRTHERLLDTAVLEVAYPDGDHFEDGLWEYRVTVEPAVPTRTEIVQPRLVQAPEPGLGLADRLERGATWKSVVDVEAIDANGRPLGLADQPTRAHKTGSFRVHEGRMVSEEEMKR
jgi:hypothetical protein